MKIALFGGAFDPPTVGHVAIVRSILDKELADEVWVTPYFTNYYRNKLTDIYHRLYMCEKAMAEFGCKVHVFDYEWKHKLSGKTIDFVHALASDSKFSNYHFFMVIGQDNAENFKDWYDYKELLSSVKFIVLPRPPLKVSQEWYLHPPHIFLKDIEIPQVSSTNVREALKKTKPISNMVPKPVENYLKNNNLFFC